jgi:ABC-2 type transport system permease protein
MDVGKTYAVMVKETRHILRDRMTFLMLLLIPVFLMIAFSYSLAVDVNKVPITLMDDDRSRLSRQFVAALSSGQDLVVGPEVEDYAQIKTWFDQSRIKAVVVIPPDFSERLLAGKTAEIQVLVDGTDPATGQFAIDHILTRSQGFGQKLALQVFNRQAASQSLAPMKEPIDLRTQIWYNPGLKNEKGIVPAMLALVLSLPAVAVMSAIVRERELGTLETVFATPLSRGELLVGKIIPYILSSLVSAILCAAAAVYIFNAPFRGSLPLFLVLALDFFMHAFSLALLISIFLPSQAAASLLGLLIFLFPGFFLSGVFYPISAFPELVREEASFLPSTPFVTVVRGLMIKGQGLATLWPQAALMLGMSIMLTFVSILLFEKKIR